LGLIYRVPLDPSAWTEVCEALAVAGRGAAAGIRPPVAEYRVRSMPHSASMAASARAYVRGQWYKRDTRDRGRELLATRGFFSDQDIVTEQEMKTDPFYADFLAGHGLRWSLAIGFRVSSNWWAATIQRSPEQGPFTREEQESLARLGPHLARACATALALKEAGAAGFAASFQGMKLGAIAIDSYGKVVLANSRAEQILGDGLDVSRGQLKSTRPQHDHDVERLVASLTEAPESHAAPHSFMLRRSRRGPIALHACPISGGDSADPVTGSLKGLILLAEADAPPIHREALRELYGVTASEFRLIEQLVRGLSLQQSAKRLGIAVETARSYLKAIFAKTQTHRQGELIALLHRVSLVPCTLEEIPRQPPGK
jgi:DNA-binding CsgD family transcriptional regulator/PAS domain-containing protein